MMTYFDSTQPPYVRHRLSTHIVEQTCLQTQSLPSQAMATNITFHPGIYHSYHRSHLVDVNRGQGAVTPEERHELLGQRGLTIWFTGLSASGKVRK